MLWQGFARTARGVRAGGLKVCGVQGSRVHASWKVPARAVEYTSSARASASNSATTHTVEGVTPLNRTKSNVDEFQQTKHDMRWLLESIGGQREVSYWLEHYSSEEGSDQPFAVIKVGGGVIEDDKQLNDLCSSLAFLRRSGLNPIVIHGAGPQLNSELESQDIISDYIEGIRVTTPEILRTARRVFLDVNRRLVDALEERGTRARFIDPSLFEAEIINEDQYGLVGEIKKVQTEWISDATRSGYLPVVCSLAESSLGQTLNVNADVAAVRLAEAVMPMKMIYINTMGGLLDGDDNLIRNINYPSDYEWLLQQPWLRHGTKLKTVEINEVRHLCELSVPLVFFSFELVYVQLVCASAAIFVSTLNSSLHSHTF